MRSAVALNLLCSLSHGICWVAVGIVFALALAYHLEPSSTELSSALQSGHDSSSLTLPAAILPILFPRIFDNFIHLLHGKEVSVGPSILQLFLNLLEFLLEILNFLVTAVQILITFAFTFLVRLFPRLHHLMPRLHLAASVDRVGESLLSHCPSQIMRGLRLTT